MSHSWIASTLSPLIHSEIEAVCISSGDYMMGVYFFFFFKWQTQLTPEHTQVTRKWLHPISQWQVHWAHPALTAAKTNGRNFHFNETCLIFCWFSQTSSKPKSVYLLVLDLDSGTRCLLRVCSQDNLNSKTNQGWSYSGLWDYVCSSWAVIWDLTANYPR